MPVAFSKQAQQSSTELANSDGRELCLEAGRLNSFDQNWPHDQDSQCSRENMSKAGFYYIGHSDQVQCFSCLLKLDQWNSDDDPWIKHQELAPNCAFAKLAVAEDEITLDQWCDIINGRSINKLDSRLRKLDQKLKADS